MILTLITKIFLMPNLSKFTLMLFLIQICSYGCKKKKEPETQITQPSVTTPAEPKVFDVGSDPISISIDTSGRMLIGNGYSGVHVFEKGVVTNYTWANSATSNIVRYTFLDERNNLCFMSDASNNPPYNLFKFNGTGIDLITSYSSLPPSGGMSNFGGDSKGNYYYSIRKNEMLMTGSSNMTFSYNLSTSIGYFYEIVVDKKDNVWYTTTLNSQTYQPLLGYMNNGVFVNLNFYAEHIVFDMDNNLWGLNKVFGDTLVYYSGGAVTKYALSEKAGVKLQASRLKISKNKVYCLCSTPTTQLSTSTTFYVMILDQLNNTWKTVNISDIISASGLGYNGNYSGLLSDFVVDKSFNLWLLISGYSEKNLLKVSNY